MQKRIALVLTGGGARAAYQAGALSGIREILGSSSEGACPFQILSGISAGAINAGYLASRHDTFGAAVDGLAENWSKLTLEQVIRTDIGHLTLLGTRWLRDLSLGGMFGTGRTTYLLDTTPLWGFLQKLIRFRDIGRNLRAGTLQGLSFSATNYKTGTAVTFYDGHPDIKPWLRSSRLGRRDRLTLRHIAASAAIPILFPPVKLRGSYYGDGSVRLSAPLSPAIHLGADKLFVIGMRHLRAKETTEDLNAESQDKEVSLAQIAGVMLNASFFDTLEGDIERMERINDTMTKLRPDALAASELRPVPLFVLRPSQDLGTLASEEFKRFPLLLRHLLRGIGASNDQGWDLMSYLAFDAAYTKSLIDLGRKDALAQRAGIEAFFAE